MYRIVPLSQRCGSTEYQSSQIAKIAPTLSTMVGENFKYQSSEIAKIAPKLSTMVGENFKYRSSEIAKIAPKLSTIVGEIFKQYSQIAKIAPNCPPWLEKF